MGLRTDWGAAQTHSSLSKASTAGTAVLVTSAHPGCTRTSCLKHGPYPPNSIAPPTAQSSPASCEVRGEAGWAPTKMRVCTGPGRQQPEASRTAPRRGTQCHPPLTTATHVPVHRHRHANSHTHIQKLKLTHVHTCTYILTHIYTHTDRHSDINTHVQAHTDTHTLTINRAWLIHRVLALVKKRLTFVHHPLLFPSGTRGLTQGSLRVPRQGVSR